MQPPEPPIPSLRPDEPDRRFLRRLALVVLAVAIGFVVVRISNLLLLAFGATLGALLLSAVADWVAARTPLPRWAGLLAGSLLLFGVVGAIGWLFSVETAAQAGRLSQRLPQDWALLQARLDANPAGHMLVSSVRTGAGGNKAMTILLNAGWGGGEVLVNFLIVLIGAVFFAANPSIYRRGLILLAPRPYRAAATRGLDDTASALRLWLVTQLISMAMMGGMIAFGLWLSGLESWPALGVLGGLSEFIPYVGPTLAMIPAIVVALAGGGSVWGVLLTYLIVRVIQANIITPLISQRVVHIPPGLYIFAILAMGFTFSTFGVFFSGALSVAAFTLVRRIYLGETLGEDIPSPGHHDAGRDGAG